MNLPRDGRRRVVIEGVTPEVDAGRFPAKRSLGELVAVEADVFADGHDDLGAVLRHLAPTEEGWIEVPMRPLGNDRWRAEFRVEELGTHRFTVVGWIDAFASWRTALGKKVDAGVEVRVDLRVGARLVRAAAARARGSDDAERLRAAAGTLGRRDRESAVRVALGPELAALMAAYPDRRRAAELAEPRRVVVDRERARCGAWYELFPRSASGEPGRHGTLRDVIDRLPELEILGFDVLYLPPIHPIGRTNRKGRDNAETAGPGDVGSPWAIGADEGGHTAVHADLGTIEDVDRLVAHAAEHGIEIALDLAFQCSPDHPWVREHPEWFRHLPGGSIAFAENPPKRYEDIYPLDFETAAWKELWSALRDVVGFWIEHGVRIFRADNPHTKPFAFWEWLIADVGETHPDVIFLAEAFTRPKVMDRLAKLGFSQSYTYFAWRRTKQELQDYLTELTQSPAREFFRPNLWPNTPDILTEELRSGDPAVFAMRFILAATLGASYGIYGPAFELLEHEPAEPGSEEYRHSEKYEVRAWDTAAAEPLRDLIARVNRIRHEHLALQRNDTLRFHPIDNPRLLAYSKRTPDGSDVILVVVNLDPSGVQAGRTALDHDALGLAPDADFTVTDLLSGESFAWRGADNYVELRPPGPPAHVFRVQVPAPGSSEPSDPLREPTVLVPEDVGSPTGIAP